MHTAISIALVYSEMWLCDSSLINRVTKRSSYTYLTEDWLQSRQVDAQGFSKATVSHENLTADKACAINHGHLISTTRYASISELRSMKLI